MADAPAVLIFETPLGSGMTKRLGETEARNER
jgi:hypothetical protein